MLYYIRPQRKKQVLSRGTRRTELPENGVKEKKPELLAPAGSLAALRAAVAAGADAVYFGGQAFSARAGAQNFSREELCYAISFCHAHGVKTNITANTLVLDRELDEWIRYAEFLWQAGADAMIVADLGAAAELHRRIPEFALHASTQAGIADIGSARLAGELGFSRVVLARELQRQEIRKITAECGLETEIFLHGALCVSVSGQCLFSAAVGGRSGNRGECAQPCRLPYNGGTPLSLKDYCLAAHIPELLTLGVSSLKIEGRMKPPEYVYGVTSIYRRLLDERRACTAGEAEQLAACFSRSGFTDAYYTGGSRSKMTGVRTDWDKARSAALALPDGISVNAPAESVPFPVRQLPASAGGAVPQTKAASPSGERYYLQFATAEQLRAFGPLPKEAVRVFLPASEYLSAVRRYGKKPLGADGAVLPPVVTEGEREEAERSLRDALDAGAEAVLCGSLGTLALARKCGAEVYGSLRQNAANHLTVAVLSSLGVTLTVQSPELTAPQARDLNRAVRSACVAYGRLPLMTLSRCILRDTIGCSVCREETRNVRFSLRDRRGVLFPVFPAPGHRNVVLNSLPTYLGGCREKTECGIGDFFFLFTTESGGECAEAVNRFRENRDLGIPVRRAGTRKPEKERKNDGKSVRNRHGKLPHKNIHQGRRTEGTRAFGRRGR